MNRGHRPYALLESEPDSSPEEGVNSTCGCRPIRRTASDASKIRRLGQDALVGLAVHEHGFGDGEGVEVLDRRGYPPRLHGGVLEQCVFGPLCSVVVRTSGLHFASAREPRPGLQLDRKFRGPRLCLEEASAHRARQVFDLRPHRCCSESPELLLRAFMHEVTHSESEYLSRGAI